jgi:hypothetical protein
MFGIDGADPTVGPKPLKASPAREARSTDPIIPLVSKARS